MKFEKHIFICTKAVPKRLSLTFGYPNNAIYRQFNKANNAIYRQFNKASNAIFQRFNKASAKFSS